MENSKLNLGTIGAMLVIVWVLASGNSGLSSIKLPTVDSITSIFHNVVPLAPASAPNKEALNAAADEIVAVMAKHPDGKADAAEIRKMYNMINKIVAADDQGVIKTTEQLREGHLNSGKLMDFNFLSANGVSKYPDLNKAIDGVFAAAFKVPGDEKSTGRENKALDKQQAKEALDTLEWAFDKSSK